MRIHINKKKYFQDSYQALIHIRTAL